MDPSTHTTNPSFLRTAAYRRPEKADCKRAKTSMRSSACDGGRAVICDRLGFSTESALSMWASNNAIRSDLLRDETESSPGPREISAAGRTSGPTIRGEREHVTRETLVGRFY